MKRPFGRASTWRVSIVRAMVASVHRWERSAGTPGQTLPPYMIDFYGRGPGMVGVGDFDWASRVIDSARMRAWDRIARRSDYDEIYERYLDQHMARYKPREWEIRRFRREVEALRTEMRAALSHDARTSEGEQ